MVYLYLSLLVIIPLQSSVPTAQLNTRLLLERVRSSPALKKLVHVSESPCQVFDLLMGKLRGWNNVLTLHLHWGVFRDNIERWELDDKT
mmetsp:Transcript_34857/g.74302  ORF Transcript_34857/g.74302 Transcript_34857/m.74302 type:complete len:89 (-) Transcript_34857:56-322(-)